MCSHHAPGKDRLSHPSRKPEKRENQALVFFQMCFSLSCTASKNKDEAKQSRLKWMREANHPILCSKAPQKGQLEKRGLLCRGDVGRWLDCDMNWRTHHLLPLTRPGYAGSLWPASGSTDAEVRPVSWHDLISWGWGFNDTLKTWRQGHMTGVQLNATNNAATTG